MTPRRLDPSIVQARLSVIRGLLDDLAALDAAGQPPLAENRMLRNGVELRDDLLPSVGMRNVLVHEYLEVDLQRVPAAVPLALSRYRRYVQQVAAINLPASGRTSSRRQRVGS